MSHEHDIFDKNAWKSRNNKYAGWRDAVYSNQPVNTNRSNRAGSNTSNNDLDANWKMLAAARSKQIEESGTGSEKWYEDKRKRQRNWRLQK